MSSLAAAQADGYYAPPDWDPGKESRNAYQARGKASWQAHPLRERAKRLKSEGVLVTRFEMPFNVWCLTCERHIAKGVRFNADKKCVGQYHSTKIWSFRMKCHLCPGYIEIQTDPKAGDFATVAGARRKVETYTEEDAEVERLDTEEVKRKRAEDPFFALERAETSKRRAHESKDALDLLHEQRDARWAPGRDVELSSLMRKSLRERKRADRTEKVHLRARGIGVVDKLLPATAADHALVAAQTFAAQSRQARVVHASSAARLALGGIFDDQPVGRLHARDTAWRLERLRQRQARGMKVTTSTGAGRRP